MLVCKLCKRRYPPGTSFCQADGLALVEASSEKELDPLLGQVLGGRYRVERKIGQGGMGHVYVASHQGLGRRVAVKVLHPTREGDPRAVQRFLREARATARIVHENIVQVLDFGRAEDGRYFLAMELLEGESLLLRLAALRQLPGTIVLGLLDQLCSALEAAHSQGIVHRDLKPGNVMLVASRRGREVLKVLDFGLAKILDDAGGTLTANDEILGTPLYLAPEQVSRQPVDARTDLYALGCMGFELLTGHPPFSGSLAAVLRAHLEAAPPRAPAATKLEADLALILQRCMAKRPDDRFASARSLHKMLEKLAAAPLPSASTGRFVARRTDDTLTLGPARSSAEPTPDLAAATLSPANPLDQTMAPAARSEIQERRVREVLDLAALHQRLFPSAAVAQALAAVQTAARAVEEQETERALLADKLEERDEELSGELAGLRASLRELVFVRSTNAEMLEALRRGADSAIAVWRAETPDHTPGSVIELELALAEIDQQLATLEARALDVEEARDREAAIGRQGLATSDDRVTMLERAHAERVERLRWALESERPQAPTTAYLAARAALEELEAQLGRV